MFYCNWSQFLWEKIRRYLLYDMLLLHFQAKCLSQGLGAGNGDSDKTSLSDNPTEEVEHSVECMCSNSLQSCLTLWPYGLYSARLLCPWDFPGKNTGVGCHAILQGIFPTQGIELTFPVSPVLEAGSSPLVPPGKPRLSGVESTNLRLALSLFCYGAVTFPVRASGIDVSVFLVVPWPR